MSIVWGDSVGGSEKLTLGYEVVETSTNATVNIYVKASCAISDINNNFNFDLDGASEIKEKKVSLQLTAKVAKKIATLTTNQSSFDLHASLTGIEFIGENYKATVIKTGYKRLRPPSNLRITDNGNNTFSISADKGADGTDNKADGVLITYRIWDSNKDDWTDFEDYKKPVRIAKNTAVYARARTKGNICNSSNINKTSSNDNKILFYSKPGIPTGLKIDDNGDNTFTVVATKGINGSNNKSTRVEIRYRLWDNSKSGYTEWTTYGTNEKINITGTQYIAEVKARTVGTYTGNNNEYYYSNYTDIVSRRIAYYAQPNPPTDLNIVDLGNNHFNLSATKGSSGIGGWNPDTNSVWNPATGVEIEYSYNEEEWNPYLLGTNIEIDGDKIVYMRARTVGTYTGNDNEYYYSDGYIYNSQRVFFYTKPTISDELIVNYNSNGNFNISTNKVERGNNNEATGIRIGYKYRLSENHQWSDIMGWTEVNKRQLLNYEYQIENSNAKQIQIQIQGIGTYDGGGNNTPFLFSDIICSQVFNYPLPNFNDSENTIKVSYNTKKLNKKSIITYTWDNIVEPSIGGYRVTILVNGESEFQNETTDNFIIFEPSELQKGDIIQCQVETYMLDLDDEDIKHYGKTVISEQSIVHSPANMRVYINDEWKEGAVFVFKNDSWKEVEDIFIYNNGTWTETI